MPKIQDLMEKRNDKLCRILAVFPKQGKLLNSAYARAFGKLASCGRVPPKSKPGHSDGWGLLSWANGLPIYLGREPSDAFQSKLYDQACEKIDRLKLRAPLIGHLRKASVGLKVIENTHPFVHQNWGFAHNGTIRRLHLKSTTDSQWFFESIMREYEKNGGDMISAIAERVSFVHEAYPYSSITFILSNGNELYAYRDCTKWHNYYGMYFTETSDGMVFCQEKLFESNWQELQNRELIQVDRPCAFWSFRSISHKFRSRKPKNLTSLETRQPARRSR